jgi:hypothetical protein
MGSPDLGRNTSATHQRADHWLVAKSIAPDQDYQKFPDAYTGSHYSHSEQTYLNSRADQGSSHVERGSSRNQSAKVPFVPAWRRKSRLDIEKIRAKMRGHN